MKNEWEFTKQSIARKIGAIKIAGTILNLPMQVCLHKIGARLLGKLTICIDNAAPLRRPALYQFANLAQFV